MFLDVHDMFEPPLLWRYDWDKNNSASQKTSGGPGSQSVFRAESASFQPHHQQTVSAPSPFYFYFFFVFCLIKIIRNDRIDIIFLYAKLGILLSHVMNRLSVFSENKW